jgi:hypothetical protein
VLARTVLVATLALALCASYCGVPGCFDSSLGVALFGMGWLGEGPVASGKVKGRFERLDMSAEERSATFPGLTTEVDDAVARGPFELHRRPNYTVGLVQGRIEDGKVGVHPPSDDVQSSELGI